MKLAKSWGSCKGLTNWGRFAEDLIMGITVRVGEGAHIPSFSSTSKEL